MTSFGLSYPSYSPLQKLIRTCPYHFRISRTMHLWIKFIDEMILLTFASKLSSFKISNLPEACAMSFLVSTRSPTIEICELSSSMILNSLAISFSGIRLYTKMELGSSILKSCSLPLYERAKTIASLYRSGSICPIFHAVQYMYVIYSRWTPKYANWYCPYL